MRLAAIALGFLLVACNKPASIGAEAPSSASTAALPSVPPSSSAATSAAASATAKAPPPHSGPQSLEEAMNAAGLTPLTLKEVSHRLLGSTPAPAPRGQVVAVYTTGWKAEPAIFAKRADGTIVRVQGKAIVVVDRHVPGCPPFAGGGGDIVEGTFALPPGATYGGEVTLTYEQHIEVVDGPNDANCPPPALD